MQPVLILFLEPYDTGSHAAWMRGYQRHSAHRVEILSLPGQWWQWRMQGGAVTLARLFNESPLAPDLIIASDMLDLTTFLALTRRRTANTRTAMYFHENQLTYPPGPRIKRDLKFGFINYASALAADGVFFNSAFHRRAFLDELPDLLKHYPDHNELETVAQIRDKSAPLPVGIDLRAFDPFRIEKQPARPVILWNHRWEHDKNPEAFAHALYKLAGEGVDFEVIIAGQSPNHTPGPLHEARERLGPRVIHFGYAPDFATYARLLCRATIAVSSAWQDFFGVSMCEAIYCGCLPVMPRRLNYPDLLPAAYQELCLYNEGGLAAALRRAIDFGRAGNNAPPALREHVAAFDWAFLAPTYDQVFTALVEGVRR